MSVIVAAHISDIHFGAFDTDILLKELKHYFLKYLKKMPKLDVVFIQGDLYDHEISLNSKAAFNSFKFANKLEEILYEKNSKLRIIRGTKSHDFNQLKNLKFGKRIDFKIINTASYEKLFKNYKVLYLPEEYMTNPEEFYKNIFNVEENEYDICIGHGMFEENSFSNFNSETQISTAPIYNSKEICKIVKGPICFGHIHDAEIIRNKIYYTGSFSRWCFGEENPKGFYFSIYDTDTGNYRIIPVINKMTRKFITKNINKWLLKYDIEKIINKIDTLIYIDNIDNLRLKANEINDSDFLLKLEILKKYYSSNNQVSIEIKKLNMINNNSIEEEREKILKYNYLFDSSNSIEYQSTRFINEEFDYEISQEKVNDILNKDIIKLINDEIFDNDCEG